MNKDEKIVKFTEEQKAKILEMASDGIPIVVIRKTFSMPQRTWTTLINNDVAFFNELEIARANGLENQADSLLTITDEIDDVGKARLKSDNIKWILSKRKPSVYGDRLQLDVHQTVDINFAIDEAKKRAGLIDVTETAKQITDDNNSTIKLSTSDSQSVVPHIDTSKTKPSIEDDDIFS